MDDSPRLHSPLHKNESVGQTYFNVLISQHSYLKKDKFSVALTYRRLEEQLPSSQSCPVHFQGSRVPAGCGDG